MKIHTITILLILTFSISLKANTLKKINKLTKQQEYRKQFIKNNNNSYLLNLSKSELEKKLKSLIPKFPKDYPHILEKRWQLETKSLRLREPQASLLEPHLENLSASQASKTSKVQRLILKLLYNSKGVQAVNLWDKKIIKSYISSMASTGKPLYLPTSMQKLFTHKNNPFTKKMLIVEKFLKKNNNSRMIKYQTYNYLGPYIETYKTICKFDKKLKDKQIFKLLKRNKGKCELKTEIFKNISLKDLLKKIEFGDKQIVAKKYDNITPFVAKVILSEIILSKLNKKEQKKFLKKIINKTDFSEFTCGKFCNTKSHKFKRNVNLMIVHMGYQLVNSIKNANLLDRYSEVLIENIHPSDYDKDKKNTETIGIECSLFLQRAIERTNIAQIKGRMKTDYMDYSLVKSKIAKKIILNYEHQLKSGDIVKLHGHTYLFLGYKKIDNHYYAVTIEATGGSFRSVGIFYRDFYKPELGSFNKKLDKNNKVVNVDRNERYVIYRLR